MAKSSSRAFVLLLVSSLFLLSGILFDFMPDIVDSQIKRTVELATNQQIQSLWTRPPVDVHSYFWLFEVLNAEDFVTGQKVQLRKLGPFHSTSRIRKKVIEISANKLRITYNSSRLYSLNVSEPSSAQTDLDRPITLVNPIYGSLVAGTRYASQQVADAQTRLMISASANRLAEVFNETLLINTTAREALLGRRILLLDKVRKMAETFDLELRLPPSLLPENNIFGYLAVLNDTWSGPFEIYSGYEASQDSLGDLISYQGRRRMTEFRGRCNRLQASAGELRPMPLAQDQNLEIYQPGFCRIVHLEPTGVRKLREGSAIAYRIAPRDLASAHKNPDNRCFCQNQTKEDFCSLDGSIELGPCVYGVPLVVSVNGIPIDDNITASVSNWDDELAESSVDLLDKPDPNNQILLLKRLGLPAKVDVTITLFMKVIRDSAYKYTQNVPEVSYLPLVMVREIVSIPPPLAQIIFNLESFLALSNHLKVVMYLSCLVLLIWLVGHQYKSMSRDRVRPIAAACSTSSQLALTETDREAHDSTANSINSNRSQPPSPRGSSGTSTVGQLALTDSAGQQTGARMFSKLDEELRSRQQANALPDSALTMKVDRLASDDGNEQAGVDRSAHKSWLVKVCSNLVRLLAGLRSSINEAGQLDVSENSYQDKQLEMLAGKIDNWYNKSASPSQVEQVSPSSTPVNLDKQGESCKGAGVQWAEKPSYGQVDKRVSRAGTGEELSSVRESLGSSQTTVINRSDSIAGGSMVDVGQPEDKANASGRAESPLRPAHDIGWRASSNIVACSRLDQSGSIDESLAATASQSGKAPRSELGADSKLAGTNCSPSVAAGNKELANSGGAAQAEVVQVAAKLDPPNGISAKVSARQTLEDVVTVSSRSTDDDYQKPSRDIASTPRPVGDSVDELTANSQQAHLTSLRPKLQIKRTANSRPFNGPIAGTGNNNISNGKIMPARQVLDS